jgi:hypothetical protein
VEEPRLIRVVTVKRFASAADADAHDLEYWRAMPASERLLLVWRLTQDLWRLSGHYDDESGLCRVVTGVRRR